jgi:hypothetical protein
MADVETIIKECENGTNPQFKTTEKGEKYCLAFTGLYKKVCPHLSNESVYVETKYGNHSIDRYYTKCSYDKCGQ